VDALTALNTAFDLLLAVLLVAVALVAVAGRELFRAIVLFVTFGLLLALAWVRMTAPDVALAEAAIGSGITGALLLAARERLGRLKRLQRDRGGQDG
jgi:uncharacterized MnhB-related membrane protein